MDELELLIASRGLSVEQGLRITRPELFAFECNERDLFSNGLGCGVQSQEHLPMSVMLLQKLYSRE
jgi:hypothetical protein